MAQLNQLLDGKQPDNEDVDLTSLWSGALAVRGEVTAPMVLHNHLSQIEAVNPE